MKAVKSEKLARITRDPENRKRFRTFMATRHPDDGRFATSEGTIVAEFVVGTPADSTGNKPQTL